jgi:E3 ubiquitin-protein ligase ZNF598
MGDSAQPADPPTSPRQNHTFHRDRRRGAPGRDMHGAQNGNIRGAGFRGGQSDRLGRGRGQSNDSRIPSDGAMRPNSGRPPGLSSNAVNSASSHNDAPLGKGKAVQEATPDASEDALNDSPEGDICFICASKIEYTSIAPCNHQTCHICSLRLRALYKTRACAHCRVSPNTCPSLTSTKFAFRLKQILSSLQMILRSVTNHFKTTNSPR